MRVSVVVGVVVVLVVSLAQAQNTGLNLGIGVGLPIELRVRWERVFGVNIQGSFAALCGKNQTCVDCVLGVDADLYLGTEGPTECLTDALNCGSGCSAAVEGCARSVSEVDACLGPIEAKAEVGRK